jgi:hypothetical protein
VHELLHAVVGGVCSWSETLAAGDPARLEGCRREEEGLVTHLTAIVLRLHD